MKEISSFLDPEKLLFKAGVAAGLTVADLGAGSGFFAQASARLVGNNGKVWVVDVRDSSLDHVSSEARVRGIKNIQTVKADLEEDELERIETGTVDVVVLANLLHQIKNRRNLFKTVYRILKTGGKLVIVDWNEKPSPIGPAAAERVGEQEAKKIASDFSLKFAGTLECDSFHYGLMFIK